MPRKAKQNTETPDWTDHIFEFRKGGMIYESWITAHGFLCVHAISTFAKISALMHKEKPVSGF